ncbi:MAG: FG-GAP-like repeat-containing protein [Sphingobacteriaceae bacterium]|nr:FG-GAP-like repeat-containing protein [Sphingobacteriaceae bacterium]
MIKKIFFGLIVCLCTYVQAVIGQHAPEAVAPEPEPNTEVPLIEEVDFNQLSDLASRDGSLPVANIPHDVSVTPMGSTSINIPFQLPAGAGGFGPNLSLSYDSHGPDGVLGVGWALSGLSMITRGNRTLFHDGQANPMNAEPGAFYLDGKRLLSTNVTRVENGKTWGLYELEMYDYSKIEGELNVVNGVPNWNNPKSFRVINRDGTTYRYGIKNNESTGKWDFFRNVNGDYFGYYLSQVEDKNGNYYSIEYTKLAHVYSTPLVNRIYYGGNIAENVDHPYVFQLKYGKKLFQNEKAIPGINVIYDEYLITGFELRSVHEESFKRTYTLKYSRDHSDYFIAEVESFENENLVGRLKFQFIQNEPWLVESVDQSRQIPLAEISNRFKSDGLPIRATFNGNVLGTSLTLNRTVFSSIVDGSFYDQPTVDPVQPMLNLFFWGIGPGFFSNSGPSAQIMMKIPQQNQGDYFDEGRIRIIFPVVSPQSPVSFHINSLLSTDVINNGIYDGPMFLVPANARRVLFPEKDYILTGDVDGNGQSDLMTFFYESAIPHTDVNNWQAIRPAVYLNGILNPVPLVFQQVVNSSYIEVRHVHDAFQHYMLDVNGDGKTELLLFGNNMGLRVYELIYNSSSNEVLAILMYSNTLIKIGSANSSVDQVSFGDINGDGLQDFFVSSSLWNSAANSQLFLGSGTGFYPVQLHNPSDFNKLFTIRMADFDGDGKSEIIVLRNLINGSKKLNIYRVTEITPWFVNNTINNDSKVHYELFYNHTIWGNDVVIRSIADLDGDNAAELYIAAVNSSDNTEVVRTYKRQNFSPNDDRFARGKLVAIADNSGLTHQFRYKALTNSLIIDKMYTCNPSLYNGNYTALFTSMLVANELHKRSHDGQMQMTKYFYEDLIINKEGKGILGFKSVSSFHVPSSKRTKTIGALFTNHAILLPVLEQYLVNNQVLRSNEVVYHLASRWTGARVVQVQSSNSVDNLTNVSVQTTYSGYNSAGVPTLIEAVKGNGLETVEEQLQYSNLVHPHLPTNRLTRTKRGSSVFFNTTEQYNYDVLGRLIQQISFSGTASQVIKNMTYNGFGLLSAESVVASGQTRTTTYNYDRNGRFLVSAVDPLGYVAQNTYDEPSGRLISKTEPDNTTQSIEYSAIGDLLKVINASGRESVANKFWELNLSGSLYREEIIETARPTEIIWYDYSGNEIRRSEQINCQSISSCQNRNVITTYDNLGRVATVSDPFLLNEETPKFTTYVYDVFDRVTSKSHPDIGVVTYGYQIVGSVYRIQETLPGNRISFSEYDFSGRLVKSTDNGGSISYTYNNQLLQHQISHNGTVVSTFEYSINGLKTKHTEINAGIIEYTYNSFGELLTLKDARNQIETSVYDIAGRLISKTAGGITTNYEYFSPSDGIGRASKLKKVSLGPDNYEEYNYDQFGRMTLKSTKLPAETAIYTSYTYQNDLIASKALSSMSSTLTYTYSPIGELRDVRQGLAIIYRSTKVNALGRELTSLRSNTTISCVSQYSNGYLTAQQATRFGVSIFNFQYGWNQTTGNLTSRADLRSSLSVELFAYDALDRLTQSTVNNVPLGTAYNTQGNITYKQGVGNFSYESPKIHALVRSSPVGQQGSTQAIPPHQQDITYDALSRPATITENGFQMVFTYGANGERCKSVLSYQGTVIETRLYAGEYERVTKNGQTWHIQYISGVDGLVAMLINSNGTSQLHYVFTDHLGSIVRTVLPHGAISSEQNFDAWGRRRNPTNWTYGNVGTRPDWLIRGFTGHEHLDVFNLIHMNARLYDPLVSRMLSPDNYVVDPDATQAYNRYSYCLNNPLKYVDPDGNVVVLAPVLIGMAYGALIGAGVSAAIYSTSTAISGQKWDWGAFGRATAFGAVGGALGGGLGTLGAQLGTFGQSLGYNVLSNVASNSAAAFAFGSDVTAGGLVGMVAGGFIGAGMGNFSGISGGALKNIVAELAFGAVKGAVTGGFGGAIGAAIDGSNMGQAFVQGAKYGAIAGSTLAGLNVISMGAAYMPSRSYGDFGTNSPVYRRGTFLTKALAGEGSGIAIGRNLVTHQMNENNAYRGVVDPVKFNHFLRAHETGHYQQQAQLGFGNFYAKTMYQYFINPGFSKVYHTPGTLEYKADLYAKYLLGYGY